LYKNIFIDLDNTLWDFQTNSKNVLSVLFFKYGLDRYFKNFDEYFKIYSEHNDYLWEQYALNKINKDELNKERFAYPLRVKKLDLPEVEVGMQTNYLPLLSEQTSLMPGCIETLDYLKQKGYKLYLVSNGFVEIQHKKLLGAGLYKYFDKLFFSEDIKAHKPSRVFFDTAIKSTNSKKKESIVIGDNFLADIEGAKNAGLQQIWFCTSGNVSAELPFTPTYTITHLIEIKNIL
jgi:putative hydrolase of the HAD superfamily